MKGRGEDYTPKSFDLLPTVDLLTFRNWPKVVITLK